MPRDIDHSRRRARLRDRILIILARKDRLSMGELVKASGVRRGRVEGILEGDGHEYAYDLSLVHQGAATREASAGARVYAITPLGRAEAQRSVRGPD